MFKEFLIYHYRKIRRYFDNNSRSKILVSVLMLAVIFLIALSVFEFSRRGLEFTQKEGDPFLLQAAPLYIYQIFLVIIGYLVFASTMIFGLINFFKGDRNYWIMASPKYNSLAVINLFKAMIDSSWPIIILAVPLIFAVKSVFELSILSFFIAIFSLIFFSLFVSLFSIVLILLISAIFQKIKINSFKYLAISVGLIAFLFGAIIWVRAFSISPQELFQVDQVDASTPEVIKSTFSVFPSHLSAMTIYGLQIEDVGSVIRNSSILGSLFLFLVIAFIFLKSNFLKIWQSFQEQEFEAKPDRDLDKKRLLFKKIPNSPEGAIFRKELLFNLRSPANSLWLIFLMTLMLIQVGVVNLLGRHFGSAIGTGSVYENVLPILQLGVILFFINAFILRFVFPSFSQEGDTSWIIGSAPIDLKRIFMTKYKFFSIALTLLGLVAFSIYVIPLRPDYFNLLISIVMIVTSITTLTMIGLSLGTIFINFEENDPQKLSTSAPGIGFILASFTYIGVGAYSFHQILSQRNYLFLFFFLALSVLVCQLIKKIATESLDKLEFL